MRNGKAAKAVFLAQRAARTKGKFLFDLHKSPKEIPISLEEIHKSRREIGISLKEIGISFGDLPTSLEEIPISSEETEWLHPVFGRVSGGCARDAVHF